jgi:hypothetical protein
MLSASFSALSVGHPQRHIHRLFELKGLHFCSKFTRQSVLMRLLCGSQSSYYGFQPLAFIGCSIYYHTSSASSGQRLEF